MYMAVAGVKQKCLSIRFFFLVSFEEFYFLSGTHVIARYYRIFCFDLQSQTTLEFTNFTFNFLLYRILVNELNMDSSFQLDYRGPVAMKGKPEPMKCWFLSRSKGVAAAITPSFEDYPSSTLT